MAHGDDITSELYVDETEKVVVICDVFEESSYIFDASVQYFDRAYLECSAGESYIDYFNNTYK